MKNSGKMKRFRNIVRNLVDDEDFDASRPRAMFLKVFITFKRTEGLSGRTFSDEEHQELREVFVRTLKKEGIKMKEGILDTGTPIEERSSGLKSFSGTVTPKVTPNMIRGAHGADLRHHGMLGNDY